MTTGDSGEVGSLRRGYFWQDEMGDLGVGATRVRFYGGGAG